MDSSIQTETLHETAHHGEAHSHDVEGTSLFGFIVFLLSESVIFLSLFAGYFIMKTTTEPWLPAGVEGLEVREPLINTVVLVSSSLVIYFAEEALKRKQLWLFRGLWLLTSAMGIYFLWGQAVEWSGLSFGVTDGMYGSTFYLLTGFHGLHVLTGVLLQLLMLGRSFLPRNYDTGHVGVTEVSLFWHFVDVIWIVLFILIYIWQ
ncbi:cytochrome c oxidase subunit 3 [Leptolyngbya sp. AN02str]|uniref:cytochrome c oxidase subunit 3 n=1 Tax=Leptolyngbya sp. AN02str TaxID=3423363 RepID=UPI003D31DDA7